MLLLTVNGNKILRSDNAEHKLKLLAAGMTRNVHVVHFFVNNLSTELHKLIDNPADGLFVTGNRRCRNNNVIVRTDKNLAVVGEGHSRKCRHRLSLTARCDKHNFVVRIAVYHIELYEYTLGNLKIAELSGNGNNIFKASARKSNLSAELCGNVDYLLNAVDI